MLEFAPRGTTRFARDVEALETLLRVAEERFGLWEGALRSEDQHQPVTSYRNLVSFIAREAGYSYTLIADVLYHDHTTARYQRNRAADAVDRKHRWWTDNLVALRAAWSEALDG
jgi:hypothetical protein